MELVTSLWRQDRLRALELAALAAAATASPPSEATVKRLLASARYGARIDKDIGRALQALRVRPDACIDELPNGTSEPELSEAQQRNFTNELPPCTSEPAEAVPLERVCTTEFPACTFEPEPANTNREMCTAEPEPPALNRHQRRRLEALARKRRAA